MQEATVVITGAGPAGLALAACLKKAGVDYLLLEKNDSLAPAWRRHYDRLHLHTPRAISALPFLAYKPAVPQYPSRDEFIAYMDEYAETFGISPLLHTELFLAEKAGGKWLSQTSAGLFRSSYLVLATGMNQHPRRFSVRGLEHFPGRIVHSADFSSGKEFRRRKVLVVGFGNSAGEIAMDLCEQGAIPVMSVRSPVNVLPLKLFGIPIMYWARLLSVFPPQLSDRLSAPLRRLAQGDLSDTGLRKPAIGPAAQVGRMGKIPLIDIGTISYIRKGRIRIAPGVEFIEGNVVCFADGSREAFDDIIAATGYEATLPTLSGITEDRASDLKRPLKKQAFFGADQLYGCGFSASGTGMIRAIGMEALRIAADIRRQRVL